MNIDISEIFLLLFLFEYARVLKLLYRLNGLKVTSEKSENLIESFGYQRLGLKSVAKTNFVNKKCMYQKTSDSVFSYF